MNKYFYKATGLSYFNNKLSVRELFMYKLKCNKKYLIN